jgi:hypothetical protein
MLGALKEKAAQAAQSALAKELQIKLKDKIEMFKTLKVSDVKDDAKYVALIVQPLWLYLKVQCGMAITGLQKFYNVDVEARFRDGLFHVRNELIKVEGELVQLVPDFNERLAPTIMEAIKGNKSQ